MPDIDKVIKGLGIHADRSNKTDCDDCPYNKNCFSKGDCIDQLCSDALALLKEQTEREKRICKAICDFIHGPCSTDTNKDKDYVCNCIQQFFIK